MLPIYISYFAGGGERNTKNTLKGALGFVLGFSVVFMTMGALAGTFGSFLIKYRSAVNIVSGLIVIFFGLNYLGVFNINLFKGASRMKKGESNGFLSSVVLGTVFSIGWTPCVGAFLGSALLMASTQGQVLKGVLMLLCYSLGLGIPFVISAVLIDKMKGAFDFIKKNYKTINIISGGILILIGIMMMSGTMGKLLDILS